MKKLAFIFDSFNILKTLNIPWPTMQTTDRSFGWKET